MSRQPLLVKAECGLVVPNGEDGQLANAICYLVGNPQLGKAMSQRARILYEREFSRDRACDRIRAVLEFNPIAVQASRDSESLRV